MNMSSNKPFNYNKQSVYFRHVGFTAYDTSVTPFLNYLNYALTYNFVNNKINMPLTALLKCNDIL